MRKKRKINLFANIKGTYNPELNNKYDNEPFFQKKLEIANKQIAESNLIEFIKRFEEEEQVKAKRRKSMKSVKNLKRPLKRARAITR
jgi:hypothetical protein